MADGYRDLVIIYSIGLICVVFLSISVYHLSNKYKIIFKESNVNIFFYVSLIFYVFSVTFISLGKINALHHYADFATHLEILWRYSQNFGLTSLMSEEIHKGTHWFAAHFTPIIFLTYAPIFKIFPYAQTIAISETLFLVSSIIPLKLIVQKFFEKSLSKLFIISFLFYPTIFYINLYGIAYLELCIPLFFWLIYFLQEKKNILFFIMLILCLMIREEVALVLIFLGIYIFFNKRYFLGLLTFSISLIYFVIVFKLIIPYYKGSDIHLATGLYNSLGSSYLEIFQYIIENPVNILKKILTPPKIGNLVMFLIPLLFTPLISLITLFITVPNLAITFLSDYITNSSFILYYLSPSIPIFYYASILGLKKIRSYSFINVNSLIHSIVISSIATTIFFGATPISIAFWNKNYSVGKFYTSNFHYSAYLEDERDAAAKKIVKLIPENGVVSAEQHFLPLLFKKKKMIIFPDKSDDVTYVLIDILHPKKTGGLQGNWMNFRKNPEKFYNEYLNNKDWTIVKSLKGVTLFQKVN